MLNQIKPSFEWFYVGSVVCYKLPSCSWMEIVVQPGGNRGDHWWPLASGLGYSKLRTLRQTNMAMENHYLQSICIRKYIFKWTIPIYTWDSNSIIQTMMVTVLVPSSFMSSDLAWPSPAKNRTRDLAGWRVGAQKNWCLAGILCPVVLLIDHPPSRSNHFADGSTKLWPWQPSIVKGPPTCAHPRSSAMT